MERDAWGRVDADGTVYVRTPDGERAVGSWHAGPPEQGLAYFARRYDALAIDVDLLERRIRDTDLAPDAALGKIGQLREQVNTALAVGDLAALTARLDTLVELAEARRGELAAAREQARADARAARERIVEEAERLAGSGDWKQTGDRLRELLGQWKDAPRIERSAEQELWTRFSAARSTFDKRRRSHFAALDEQREEARLRKEKLVAEAESLAGSREWGPTAARFRDLMREWKAAGRAAREADDALWQRFRTAQDAFFSARSAVLTERDSALSANQQQKESLLAEAEALLPVRDLRSARAALRSIQERWERVGAAPRTVKDQLDGRLRKVEEALRGAEETRWRRTNPEAVARAEATIAQLRSSISALEDEAERERAAGRGQPADEAAAAAAARREWLAEAERTLADLQRP